jgi:hypothetical protein
MVEMSIHQEMLELAAEYGSSALGTSALIHLEQQSKAE